MNNADFKRQIEEVKVKLNDLDPELVEDVIRFHILSMSDELRKVRPWQRRILIRGWSHIRIMYKCFLAPSIYFNKPLTKRLLKKYQKEIDKINFKNYKK